MAGLLASAFEWLQGKITSRAQRLLLRVLAAGPVPRHVAFVMDGNRRYARINHKHVSQGHAEGYMALRRVLEICLRLDIRCVSVYAFAIENFKRSPEEVEALMDLCQRKMLELCEHGDLLQEYDVRLNVIGKTEMLPDDVLAAIHKAQDMTKNNSRSILNICMPYASTDEITTSAETCIRTALATKDFSITEEDIEENLMTTLAGSPPLDIIVRTSGVKRLSDFFLWQSCERAQVQFCSAFWPDFGLLDFVPILLDFQRRAWAEASSRAHTYANDLRYILSRMVPPPKFEKNMASELSVPPKSDRVRILMLVKRKEGISKEDFCDYWWKIHTPLMLNLIPKEKMPLKFDQMHVNDEINAMLSKIGRKTTTEWDGAGVVEANNWDDLFAIYGDKTLAKASLEDETNFLDVSETMFIPLNFIEFTREGL